MPWQSKPSRSAQRRRTGFTRARQIAGVTAFLTLGISTGFRLCETRLAFCSVDRGGRLPTCFAVFASFPFRANEHGRMEAFLVPVHSPSPRF